MPYCKKCSNYFPFRKIINEKERILSKRTHCLECVPFNSRKKDDPEGREATCCDCGKKYIYNREKGSSKKRCNSCIVNKRRFEIKKNSVDYLGGECCICGYNKCISALEFHHIDPEEKKFSISSHHCRSWKSIKEELDKCVLLCSNHHREVEAKMISVENLKIKRFPEKVKDYEDKIRRKRKVKKCKECSEEIKSKGSLCVKCSRINQRKVKNRPSKINLKEMIKNMNWCEIGRKYGVSDNAVRKWARGYDLI